MKPWFDVVPADRLGKYELVRHLASGGMARIYLARVVGIGGFERHVVLKTVRPERIEDESYLTMFLDEARLLATLHHQHVAQVYEVGIADDGTYFLAMEYLHGETVRAALGRARHRQLRLPFDYALTVIAAAAAGLHHAHERRGNDGQPLGIVHRDVSPSNIICGYDGSVKLIDFGIAKADTRTTVTQTGFVKGKAGYMAPEQALGYRVDRRSDVYALGVVMYELCTQHRAFRAASEHEAVQRMVRGDVTPPSKLVAGFPRDLEDVILHALELDPDDRFRTCEDMRLAIERVAGQLGAAIGPGGVSRVLADLFGVRPEPWLAGAPLADEGEAQVTTESAVLVAMSGPPSRPPEPLPEPVVAALAKSAPVEAPPPAMWAEASKPPRARTTTQPPSLPPIPRQRTTTLPPPQIAAPPPAPPQAAPPQAVPPPRPSEPEDLPTQRFSPVEDLRVPGLAPAFSAQPARARAPTTPLRVPLPDRPAPSTSASAAAAATTIPPSAPLPAALPPVPMIAPAPRLEPAPRTIAVGTAPPPFTATPAFGTTLLRPRRRALAIALPCAAILGAALALWIIPGNGDDTPDATTATAATPTPGAPAPTPAPHAPTAHAQRAPAPPSPPPTPATITIHVTTDPSGGTVVLDGVRLGTAPYTGTFAAQPGKTGTLKVRMHGYFSVRESIALDHDATWTVHLHHANTAD